MITKSRDLAYYELQNGRSVNHINHNRAYKALNQMTFSKPVSKIRFLDIGCRSNARTVQEFHNAGYQAYGMDIGEEARKVWDREHKELNLAQGDIHDGIMFPGKWDIISASHVLEHCYSPSSVTERIYKALNKGGYFWCQVPTAIGASCERHTPHYCYFESPEDHETFLKGYGFEIISHKIGGLEEESAILARK